MKVIKPVYYENFKCIGDKCTNTCCTGWNIWIDKDSFEKYQNEDDEFSKVLKKNIKKKIENEDDNDYGEFILDYDNRCPMLNTNNLCEIYINKGEESLCRTCTIFPRTGNNYIEDILEKNLEVSCPVVAEYLTMYKDGIEFIEKEEEISSLDEKILVEWYDGDIEKDKLSYKSRNLYLDIIRNKDINIEARLAVIKRIQDDVQLSIENDDDEKWSKILKDSKKENYKDTRYSDNKSRVKEKYNVIYDIINYIFSEKFFIDERLERHINLLIKFIKENSNTKELEDIENRFNNFFYDKVYILENYLTYDIYKNYMNSIVEYDGDRVIDLAIVTYTILKSIFLASWNKNGELDSNIIVEILTLYEKYIQEDFIRDQINEYLEENNLKILEKLRILM